MPETDPRPPTVKRLAEALLAVFFRRVEVEGLERLPGSGPLLIVANHHNSLIDPVLLLGRLPLRPRFLAKSTLWNVPGVRQLLDWAGSIPVYRRQDEGEDTTRNQETFAACFEELRSGGCIALFPEGISHDAPRLAGLKTGAARIAQGAEEAHGPLGLRIVPVGLTFDDKGRFRSRALIQVGEPLDPGPELVASHTDPRTAARNLTERIREALYAVTLNYPAPDTVAPLERAAEVSAERAEELPLRIALSEAAALRRAAIGHYERLLAQAPERAAALHRTAARYDAQLERLSLRDDHLRSRYRREDVAMFVAGSASLVLVSLPLALVGTLLNFIPYRLLGFAARRMRTEDLPATVKLFGGFFLFPLYWAVQAVALGAIAGPVTGLISFAIAPLTGYFAMLFHERYDQFLEEAGAWLTLKLRRRSVAAARRDREALERALRTSRE